jgi:hypothetical protein
MIYVSVLIVGLKYRNVDGSPAAESEPDRQAIKSRNMETALSLKIL